jgi:hypothetical protein
VTNACTGMDMTSKPSMMQLMKFMADSDVRAGAKKLSETFQKAGINFGSKVRVVGVYSLTLRAHHKVLRRRCRSCLRWKA